MVVLALLTIAGIRYQYMHQRLGRTILQAMLNGALVLAIGLWLGRPGTGA